MWGQGPSANPISEVVFRASHSRSYDETSRVTEGISIIDSSPNEDRPVLIADSHQIAKERGIGVNLYVGRWPHNGSIDALRKRFYFVWEWNVIEIIDAATQPSRKVKSWSLAEVFYGNVGDEAPAVWRNTYEAALNKHICPQLFLGILIGALYKGLGGKVEKYGCKSETDGESSNYECAKGGKEFVSRFDVADKSFPIIVLLVIAGPALGLILGVGVSLWLGGAILLGWLGFELLVVFLMTLGV